METRMGCCMECDEAIPYDSDECPECGLEAPVAYRWYRESHEPAIIKAREDGDPMVLADLLFYAWYDAGSLPDYYVMGDLYRELNTVYRENKMYERLVFQLCHNYSDYEQGSREDGEEALALVKEIGREDLELYVYEQIDGFNRTVYHKDPPEHIASRKAELYAKIEAGELQKFDPEFGPEMWVQI